MGAGAEWNVPDVDELIATLARRVYSYMDQRMAKQSAADGRSDHALVQTQTLIALPFLSLDRRPTFAAIADIRLGVKNPAFAGRDFVGAGKSLIERYVSKLEAIPEGAVPTLDFRVVQPF